MTLVWMAAFAYLGYLALLFLAQRAMVFPGATLRLPPGSGAGAPPGVEQVWLPFSQGRAEAWFLPAAAPPPWPAILFAHGNAELIGDWIGVARAFAERGVAVMLVEYPGYGRSEGRPSRGTIAEVFIQAHDWISAHPDVDADRIVGMGRSLGGGPITDLSRERPLGAIVLTSTFRSAARMARRMLAPGFLVRDRFDNEAALTVYPGPVLIFHGRRDDVVPYTHGARLAALNAAFELVTWDCAHNDCPPDPAEFVRQVVDFLERASTRPQDSPASDARE